MNEINKVLEAEKTIQEVSEELIKMKKAAQLMDGAQEKVDAVINSSNEIIAKTGEFVKEGKEIVKRIGDYDIQRDLQILKDTSNEIQTSLENLSEKNDKIIKLQEKNIKDINSSMNDVYTKLKSESAEQSKLIRAEVYAIQKSQKVSRYFNIGTLVLLAVIILISII